MTAKDYWEDKFINKFRSWSQISDEDIINMLKEFAKEKCKEQRELCQKDCNEQYEYNRSKPLVINTEEPDL